MQSPSKTSSEVRIESGLDIESAINWILNSGIQRADGSFSAWYDCEKRAYSFSYPEITGYATRFLSQLYQMQRNDVFLGKAIVAGDWMSRIWKDHGSLYCRFYEETGEWDRSQYAFDTAICLSSLLELYNVTSDSKYKELALEMGDRIIEFQALDGSLIAGYDHEGSIINDPHWSQTKGCHNLKTSLALLKLYEVTGGKKYFRSAKELLRWGMRLQSTSGEFFAFEGSNETYAHAHCYAVEGILFSSRMLNTIANPSLSEHAIYAAEWLSKIQNDDGSIWNWHNSNKEKMKVSDALSQAIRIWTITRNLANESDFITFSWCIKKGLNFLRNMQCSGEDKRSYGGIYYALQNGRKIRHINTWATLFATQASLFSERRKTPELIDLLL